MPRAFALALALGGSLGAFAQDFAARAAVLSPLTPGAMPAPGRRSAKPRWFLWLRPEDEAALTSQGEDWLLRLRVEGQAATLTMALEAAKELAPAVDWDSRPRWVLLTGQGEEAGRGSEFPAGGRILGLFRQGGNTPAWEDREAFLKIHPDLGPAWGEAVWKEGWLARMRLRALQRQGQVASRDGVDPSFQAHGNFFTFTSPDPEVRATQAETVFGDLEAALEGLMNVPGWEENVSLILMPPLVFLGAGESPGMRRLAKRALDDLETGFRRDPGKMAFGLWSQFSLLAGNSPGRIPSGVIPAPGQVWPSLELVLGGLAGFENRRDWEGALAFLVDMEALLPQVASVPEEVQELQISRAFIAAAKALPLLKLDRAKAAAAALDEGRRLAPSHWKTEVLPLALDSSIPDLPMEVRAAINRTPPPEPAPAPFQPPLRLGLLGEAAWKDAWSKLRKADALLPWSPSELEWEKVAQGEAEALRKANRWGAEPRWVLRRGKELLASGAECPAPLGLAANLALAGPPMLRRLDFILECQPDHLGAHRARLELLKKRMPESRLEIQLAEDARAVQVARGAWAMPPIPLDFGPNATWRPDPALWQWSALQVLPEVEKLVRSWPDNAAYWQAWTAWSRFHPARPEPSALARTLELRGSQAEWMRDLIPPVNEVVTEALRRDGAYQAMVDWLLDAWQAQDTTPAREVPPEKRDQPFFRQGREELNKSIVKPLEEALVELGRPLEAAAIDRTYREMLNSGF